MYIYNVGYGTYEESSYTQFISARQLDKSELSSVVEDCLFECLKFTIKKDISFQQQNPDPDPYYHRDTITADNTKITSPTMQDLFYTYDEKHGEIFKSEMAKRDLKPVEFEQNFSVFGWASSVDSTSWGDQSDDESRSLANKLCKRIENDGMIVKSKNEDSDADSVSE